MSHNPSVVNPRMTTEYAKKLAEAAVVVMKSPTLSPILQGRDPEGIEKYTGIDSVQAHVLDQSEIDSLLGLDADREEDLPKMNIVSALRQLHKGISSLAGRRAWKTTQHNIYLEDRKIYIAHWDKVNRRTIWSKEEWIPTREDLLATDWETGD